MRKVAIGLYWAVAAVVFALAVARVFLWTPQEATMGIVQKIFYFHMPIAINTFVALTVVPVGGIGYLLQRKTWWHDLAAAGAKVGVILCTGVLLTGMLWARGAWGVWWTWSPRLTFSLMLWLLFVVYLLVRMSIEGAQRRAVVSAVYGLVAYLDVPLVWLSARLLPDIHPGNIGLSDSMKVTLLISFVPVTLVTVGLLVLQYKVFRLERALRSAEEGGAFEVVMGGTR